VKQAPLDDMDSICPPYERDLEVDSIFQTHDGVSGKFSDARTFDDLIKGLGEGRIDRISQPFLKLDVVEWLGKCFFSINNRRLVCLKLHQRNLRRQRPTSASVRIGVQAFPLPLHFCKLREAHPMYLKFMRAYSTRSNGTRVFVRMGRDHEPVVHR
jgi:hypothetical protein